VSVRHLTFYAEGAEVMVMTPGKFHGLVPLELRVLVSFDISIYRADKSLYMLLKVLPVFIDDAVDGKPFVHDSS